MATVNATVPFEVRLGLTSPKSQIFLSFQISKRCLLFTPEGHHMGEYPRMRPNVSTKISSLRHPSDDGGIQADGC